MTPEEAQALIDGIDPRNEHHMWADFTHRYDPHTVYDACETIANMRHEYAIKVQDEPRWLCTKGDAPRITYNEAEGDIYSEEWEAAGVIEQYGKKYPDLKFVIMRRQVTEWEENHERD